MNVLFVATESAPYYRTGGLADVVHGLAKELCTQGHDARIIVPHYRTTTQEPAMIKVLEKLPVNLGDYSRTADLWKVIGKPVFYFVEQSFYFSRDDLYGYADDYARFIFFTHFALEMLSSETFQEEESNWFPQIIQGYDWATGLIPKWLADYRNDDKKDTRFNDVRFSLFVHNIRRLGKFGSQALSLAEQKENGIYDQIGESTDQINFLGRGLLFADQVITVNPEFSHPDNPLPESAEVVREVLQTRLKEGSLTGVISGIDVEEYNPASDEAIKQTFTSLTIDQRVNNKLALQAELGFKVDEGIPLLGMVSRLIPENGFDLLSEIERHRNELGEIQLAILAAPGNMDYQETLRKWGAEQDGYAPWIKSRFSFDGKLARQIYAGCDIYLLPAKELPSGIKQLIAMHYGAVPVVHHTGALCKTVFNYQPEMRLREQREKGMGVGFTFKEFSKFAFLDTLKFALQMYRESPKIWHELQLFNMRERFTWDRPADKYLDLYDRTHLSPPREVFDGKKAELNKEIRLRQALEEIGNLPGITERRTLSIFRPTADLIRSVLSCDAVYIRGAESDFDKPSFNQNVRGNRDILIMERSIDRQHERNPDEEQVINLLNQSSNNTWRQLGDVDREGICQPISELTRSAIARNENWIVGWSVPVLAHGHLFGWVDVLFTKFPTDEFWIVSSLSSLANAFGLRLDTFRIADEMDMVAGISLELLQAQSVDDVIYTVSSWLQKRFLGSHARVYHIKNSTLELINHSKELNYPIKLAQRALENRQTVYITEWNEAPRGEDNRRLYRSVLAIPIMPAPGSEPDNIDGVLMVISEKQAAFTREDENLLSRYLSPQIYAALQKARWVEEKDRHRVSQLEKLVSSLVAGPALDELLQKVVDTIADVLEVRSTALYLLNDATQQLEIRAANGYQNPLLKKKVTYQLGEGLTGWIALHGEIVKADSLDELHSHPGWRGYYNKKYKVPEPEAFLGIPLIIRETESKKVIGVLKVEDPKQFPQKTFFGEEDVHLGLMMANVIATTVYNVQKSEKRLRDFSTNLRELSDVLTGSRDMPTLMDNIIKKIAQVLHVDAASLYLADENRTELVIQAAAGYQEPLVKNRVKYRWGQGVTGKIAANKKTVVTQSIEELYRMRGSHRGTHDELYRKHFRPQSFYGLPLSVREQEKAIGVLKVESTRERFFSNEDGLLIEMMANVIATVVYNAQQSEKRLRDFSTSLRELAEVFSDSRDMPTLMDSIIKKIAQVLHVDAASLYLADENGTELVIQAAAGYQEPLVREKVKYKWGQAVTGAIAATKQAIVTQSLEELRRFGDKAECGTYDHLHRGQLQPQSFYGLPLLVKEKEHAIGVLKVESTKGRFFSSEDVLLFEMMANIIATVVYNAQQSEKRLRNFSVSLRELSNVLAGSRDMSTLMDNVVKKITDVLRVDAASLYLADEHGTELVIQAAAGYQEPLVKEKVKYKWGQAVTGKIAADKVAVVTQSLKELRRIGDANRGVYDHLHLRRLKPQSFYGLPLVVSEKEHAIGVLKVESTRERFFSSEDVLLIEMMANVIATMVYNAQQSQKHIGSILQRLGSLSAPDKESLPDLLAGLACSQDTGILDQLGKAIASVLDHKLGFIETEAQKLFEIGAEADLYERIALWSRQKQVKWKFSLFHSILSKSTRYENWAKVMDIAEPWLQLEESSNDPRAFSSAAHALSVKIADAIQSELGGDAIDKSSTWFGFVLNTEYIFATSIDRIPIVLQRQGDIDESIQDHIHSFAQKGFEREYKVLLLILWSFDTSQEQIERLKQRIRIHAIDIVVMSISEILQILYSPKPSEIFRSLVLRQVKTTSPFIIVGPVPDSMFFGREKELRQIIEYVGSGRSCVILGGRRTGKTSILSRLARVRLPDSGFCTLYHDCSTTPTYHSFLSAVVQSLRPKPQSYTPQTIEELIESSSTVTSLVLLLDEADKLVPFDRQNNWRLFKWLRALINSGKAQIVLCGERAIQNALQDETSPLFNLSNPMLLGPLRFNDVEELVTRPMKQLEIELMDERAIVRSIYDFTSGHPNIVQRLCRRLIEHLNEQNIRRITIKDIETIINDPKFQEEDFLQTYWERATPLEKIISLLMAQEDKSYRLQTVLDLLASHTLKVEPEIVKAALDRLITLRSILQRDQKGYRFAVKAFPSVIASTTTAEDLLIVLKSQYLKNPEEVII